MKEVTKMATLLRHPGKIIQIDDQGYLVNMSDWDEEVAQDLAFYEGIDELTEEKMQIVKFMREYYMEFKAFPILSYVCKHINRERECVEKEFLNPEKAWKIAGLPKLDNIRFTSVDGKHYHMEECC